MEAWQAQRGDGSKTQPTGKFATSCCRKNQFSKFSIRRVSGAIRRRSAARSTGLMRLAFNVYAAI